MGFWLQLGIVNMVYVIQDTLISCHTYNSVLVQHTSALLTWWWIINPSSIAIKILFFQLIITDTRQPHTGPSLHDTHTHVFIEGSMCSDPKTHSLQDPDYPSPHPNPIHTHTKPNPPPLSVTSPCTSSHTGSGRDRKNGQQWIIHVINIQTCILCLNIKSVQK